MTIGRMQMNRQLYGLGSLVGREKFGIGSSLKKFVRKIIPNEVSKVATTVAPFIAPFDPATAAVLSSVGSFDQTGRMGDSLKRGALTYGGGQIARYLGGADFQALPGTQGFAGQSLLSPQSYSQGIMSAIDPRTGKGLTMPTGSKTGFKLAKDVPFEEGVPGVAPEGYYDTPLDKITQVYDPLETEAGAIDITKSLSTSDNLKNIIKGSNVSGNAFELLKKGGDQLFYTTNKAGQRVLDKKAVLAAAAGAASFLEAEEIASNAGVDLTEKEYNEAKAKKKSEYDSYLSDFFKRTEKSNGGRIGYKDGSDDVPPISGDELKKLLEEFMKNQDKQEEMRKKFKDGTNIMEEYLPEFSKDSTLVPEEDIGNMGVMTKGLPKEAYEQEDQSISYLGPDAKETIFESLSKMKPGPQSSIIEFMMKSGKLSEDDYNEFIERLQLGVEDEETRITKQDGGSMYTPEQVLKMRRYLFSLEDNPDLLVMDDKEIVNQYMQLADAENRKNGGRIGYASGSKDPKFDPSSPMYEGINKKVVREFIQEGIPLGYDSVEEYFEDFYGPIGMKEGGRIGKAVGGIMDLPVRQNAAGINELDLRQSGGFVPVGVKERADDVPAMLSKNEFVLTADAVRGVGNGSVETGAKKLYNMMKEAEQVGKGMA